MVVKYVLYIGGLKPEVNEAVLLDTFQPYGAINRVDVVRDPADNTSRGFGFVSFERHYHAWKAYDQLNCTELMGAPMRIMWSEGRPETITEDGRNIFIRGLDPGITDRALFETLRAYGTIRSLKIVRYDEESTTFAFVHYEEPTSADRAILKLDGMLLNNSKVSMGPFIAQSERIRGNPIPPSTNIYVKNFGAEMDENQLGELFQQHGTVKSTIVMRTDDGESKKFGFVAMETVEEAERAIAAVHGTTYNESEVPLYCGFAQAKHRRMVMLKDAFERRKDELFEEARNRNLYVKPLRIGVDEDVLREAFAQFGTITSLKVMRAGEVSKGFGFICFSTAEEAANAIQGMNCKILGGETLFVGLAQRRSERLRMLRERHAQRLLPANGVPPPPQMVPQQWMASYPQMPAPGYEQLPPVEGESQQPQFMYQDQMAPQPQMMPQQFVMGPPASFEEMGQQAANMYQGPPPQDMSAPPQPQMVQQVQQAPDASHIYQDPAVQSVYMEPHPSPMQQPPVWFQQQMQPQHIDAQQAALDQWMSQFTQNVPYPHMAAMQGPPQFTPVSHHYSPRRGNNRRNQNPRRPYNQRHRGPNRGSDDNVPAFVTPVVANHPAQQGEMADQTPAQPGNSRFGNTRSRYNKWKKFRSNRRQNQASRQPPSLPRIPEEDEEEVPTAADFPELVAESYEASEQVDDVVPQVEAITAELAGVEIAAVEEVADVEQGFGVAAEVEPVTVEDGEQSDPDVVEVQQATVNKKRRPIIFGENLEDIMAEILSDDEPSDEEVEEATSKVPETEPTENEEVSKDDVSQEQETSQEEEEPCSSTSNNDSPVTATPTEDVEQPAASEDVEQPAAAPLSYASVASRIKEYLR